jgi:hypothetical protein
VEHGMSLETVSGNVEIKRDNRLSFIKALYGPDVTCGSGEFVGLHFFR